MSRKDSIELIIARAHSEGREKFGDLGLELTAFAGRISSIGRKHLGSTPSPEAALDFVKELHGRDLYLATACAQSSPGKTPAAGAGHTPRDPSLAWRCLEATYKGLICDLVRFMYRSSYASKDLADSVLADLFLPDRSGSSRIASYDGRSSLSTWLRVVVCNRVINAQRCCATSKSADLVPELPDRGAQHHRGNRSSAALRTGPGGLDGIGMQQPDAAGAAHAAVEIRRWIATGADRPVVGHSSIERHPANGAVAKQTAGRRGSHTGRQAWP
jgi:hypothetical protein